MLRHFVFGLLALSGCTSSFAPTVPEPLRLSHLDDVSADELAFIPTKTSFVTAEAALARRATGVTKSTGSFGSAKGNSTEELAVLGGDFQRSLHLFKNGLYWRSESLPADAPAYGLALGLAQEAGSPRLLVVEQSPLAGGSGNRILLYRVAGHGLELEASRTLDDLAKDHGGMSHPRLIGRDLAEGVLLIARDDAGVLWADTYLFFADEQGLRVVERTLSDSMRCSCVRGYVDGKLDQ